MSIADALRLVVILGDGLLAVLLPTAIRVHVRDERRGDARLLAWTIWAVYATAALFAVHRFGVATIHMDILLVNVTSLVMGFTYVVRNIQHRRKACRSGDGTGTRERG